MFSTSCSRYSRSRVGHITLSLAVALTLIVALWGLVSRFSVRPAFAEGVIYVDRGATGIANGRSWNTAFTNLQNALAAAHSGNEIWVAAGVYYPDEGAGQINNNIDATFQLKNGVAIYGGFAGTESTRDERDWVANVTVLSGDIDGNDSVDANGVVTDVANITGVNAKRVFTNVLIDASAVIDGFTITAGQTSNSGGGMLNSASGPTLNNLSFVGNQAKYGGGMSNSTGSSPTLNHVSFVNNQANYAAGMENYDNSSPTLNNVSFTGNQSTRDGGGMFSSLASSPTLNNVSFTDNRAYLGGGMYNGTNSNPVLTNVSFAGNQAENSGGGIYSSFGNPTLVNVAFWGNRANIGGAMLTTNGSLSLTNVSVVGNWANGSIGGLYNGGSSLTIQNSILWNNRQGNQTGTAAASFANSAASTTIRHSLLQGLFPTGDGNLDGRSSANDPRFVTTVDPASAPTSAGDLHLQAHSPAINAGDNHADLDAANPLTATISDIAADLSGDPRLVYGVVDLGAYESPYASFRLTARQPAPNALGVSVTAPITASFDANLNASTVTSRTFAAHTSFGGLITGTHSVDGNTLTLDPERQFFAGEGVQVIGTDAIRNNDGTALSPKQWGFQAGPVTDRCVDSFTNPGLSFALLTEGDVAWADYDGDGDLDFLFTGYALDFKPTTLLYRNEGGSFVDSGVSLVDVAASSVAWGDYDNDGDPDILITGRTPSNSRVATLYRNNRGSFTDVNAGLTGVDQSSVAWGDYDNDGDLDILLSGTTLLNSPSGATTIVYRNDGGTFVDIGAGLANIYLGSATWSDFDNDGDLDILLIGSDSTLQPSTVIYRNDDGVFSVVAANLTDLMLGNATWGDVDNDGDLDLFITGADSSFVPTTRLYLNNGGNLAASGVVLPGLQYGRATLGDYDNDGDLDLLLFGRDNSGNNFTTLYRNDSGSFVASGFALSQVAFGSTAWADYDNDGDLDLFLSGVTSNSTDVKLYRNEDCIVDTDVAIVKSVTSTQAAPGAPITYTLTFTNYGPDVADGVVVRDSVPLSVTAVNDAWTVENGATISQTGSAPNFVWEISDLPAGASGVITLTGNVSALLNADGVIANTASITVSSDITPANNLSAAAFNVSVPRVGFSAAAYSVGEADSAATITLTLDVANPFAAVTVLVQSSDDSATAPADYTAISQTVSIPAATTAITVSVPIAADAIDETDEHFNLTVSNPVGGALSNVNTATLTILDDDSAEQEQVVFLPMMQR